MALPILTTGDDVKAIVAYLKNKPTGATLAEAKAVVKSQVLDPRKVTAYQFWGVIQKDGERLKLAPLGWDLARKTKPEHQIFREIIDAVPPYRSVLEWAHHQTMESVTNNDVAAHWDQHHSDALGTKNENTIKDQAVCFFRVCEAAELGTVTIGRKGQATRISFDRQKLESVVEAGPSTPPWVPPPKVDEETADPGSDARKDASNSSSPAVASLSPPTSPPGGGLPISDTERQKVFISHGKNTALVEQVETMLGLAEITSEIAVKEETAAIPVPDKVFSAMKRCHAAIIVVAVEEANKRPSGEYGINENVLIEIGAAFVLYDRRVVLLWDKRLPVPSNLQGLYRCEFEGDELTWGAGMKLMKAIKGFKT
jgi:predicted nucleotide-binding protein with TIR-like domain